MNFKEKNEYSFLHNQQSYTGRTDLVNMVVNAAGLNRYDSIENIKTACYFITTVEKYVFGDLINDGITDIDIARFLFSGGYFIASQGCYQTAKGSSKNILYYLSEANLIKEGYSLLDIDFRYSGWNRQRVYDKMIEQLHDYDNPNLRVCFVPESKWVNTPYEDQHDHALIVTVDENGMYVICDTSYRSHEWPDNKMEKYITPENIRWFTQIV